MKKLILFLLFFSATTMAGANCGNPAGHCVCGNCPLEQIKRVDECMEDTKEKNRKLAMEKCTDQLITETVH